MTLIYNDNVVLENVVAFSCYQQETGGNRLKVRFANGEMLSTAVKNAWRVIKERDESGNVVSSIRCSLLSRHQPLRALNLGEYRDSQEGYRIPKLLAVLN